VQNLSVTEAGVARQKASLQELLEERELVKHLLG